MSATSESSDDRGALAPLAVRFRARLRGECAEGRGTVHLDARGLELRRAGAAGMTDRWRLDFASLQALHLEDDHLALRGERGSEVELHASADALGALVEQLVLRCCTLPELTQALPTMGTRRAAAPLDDEHARFFAPLLDARRVAEQARTIEEAVRALDGARITARLLETVASLAAARFPEWGSARRALDAQLTDAMDLLTRALADQARAAESLLEAAGAARLERWRSWIARVRESFLRADESWRRLRPLLAAQPVARPRRWWTRGG